MKNLKRRKFLKLFGPAAVFPTFSPHIIRGKAIRKPNILFIHIDDMDYDEIGAFEGEGLVWTPHMDSIVKEGLKINRGYVNSPVCVPSRYSTLTGKYVGHSNYLKKNYPFDRILSYENINRSTTVAPVIRDGEKTIAHYLKSAGYYTGMVGKYHNDDVSLIRPVPVIEGDPHDPTTAKKIKKHYEETLARVKKDSGFDFVERLYYDNKEQFVAPKALQVINTPWITEGALKFLDKNKDKPFFLYYSNPIPHGRVSNKNIKGSGKISAKVKNTMIDADILATPMGFLKKAPDVQPSKEDAIARAKKHAPDYAPNNALMTWLDDSVGVLLKKIKQLGLEENTIIFLLSDHQSVAKFSPYENGVRTPFGVKWKGHIKPCSVCNDLVGSIDILPTMCDIAGVTVPEGAVNGVSFRPLFKDPSKEIRKSFLIEFGFTRAVVTKNWKYIAIRFPDDLEKITPDNKIMFTGGKRPHKPKQMKQYPHYCDADQLYDLRDKVVEKDNLYNNPEYKAEQKRMKELLGEYLKQFPHCFGEFKK